MQATRRRFKLVLGAALSGTVFCAAGCASGASQEPERYVVLHGTAQPLAVRDNQLRAVVRWRAERTEHDGVYIHIGDVAIAGPNTGAFVVPVTEPPAEVLDHESDGDYDYTSAELVLIDGPSLSEGGPTQSCLPNAR